MYRYTRNKLLLASWNSKSPDKPKGKHQKALETKPKITEVIENRLMAGRNIPFNFEEHPQCFFYLVTILSCSTASFLRDTLLPPVMPLLYILMPTLMGITGMTLLITSAISLTPMLLGARTVAWISITSATRCSYCPAITSYSARTSLFFCILPVRGDMIPSAFLSLSINWKNICRLFPLKTSAWTPQWTIISSAAF